MRLFHYLSEVSLFENSDKNEYFYEAIFIGWRELPKYLKRLEIMFFRCYILKYCIIFICIENDKTL